MTVQSVPVRVTPDAGTARRTTPHAVHPRSDRGNRSATHSRRGSVASATRRRTNRAGKPSSIINLLAVVVTAMFVASMTGLAVFVPPNGDLLGSGSAVISGAVGMLAAVAGLVVGYAKAVQVGNSRQLSEP